MTESGNIPSNMNIPALCFLSKLQRDNTKLWDVIDEQSLDFSHKVLLSGNFTISSLVNRNLGQTAKYMHLTQSHIYYIIDILCNNGETSKKKYGIN